MRRKAVIVGAGPAGLTAAYELLGSDVQPVVLEAEGQVGGLSKTVEYHGNRLDVGGHRFFSKSKTVMRWWLKFMPLANNPANEVYVNNFVADEKGDIGNYLTSGEALMLLRNRLSRIFFNKRFFSYPVSLSWATVKNLGLWSLMKITVSYIKTKLFPPTIIASLEDFFISRFGTKLYKMFFQDYTEKVWGIPCSKLSAQWGAQRVKGLSIYTMMVHVLSSCFSSKRSRKVETSLIDKFLYPQLGPGQLWEQVAEKIAQGGGQIQLRKRLVGVSLNEVMTKVVSVDIEDLITGERTSESPDYLLSSAPINELFAAMHPVPDAVREIATKLMYRDFITVGVLVKKEHVLKDLQDNWIYVQDRHVRMGRIQIFNNWSPLLVSAADSIWFGLEYFCSQGDDLWKMSAKEMADLAVKELRLLEFIDSAKISDLTIIRVPKAYPMYYGAYDKFDLVREFLDRIDNLYPIGRNGMHRYNNMDHSMLTAMAAARCLKESAPDKQSIWNINSEQDYHEDTKTD